MCDFSYYPVMPWTYINFEDVSIDLTKQSNYRDLSKPLGALSSELLETLKFRMNECSDCPIPFGSRSFLYGSHYSTAAYVVYWLLRLLPEEHLRLQNGRFDTSSRLFQSVQGSWETLTKSQVTLLSQC